MIEDRPPIVIDPSIRSLAIVKYHRIWFGGTALAIALLVPLIPYFHTEGHRFELVVVLLYAIVGLSITMLMGWAGQVSLGQFALVGAGAFLAARFIPHGWSLPVLFVVAGAIGALIMVIIGLPALRVRGLTLAVTTLGLAVVAPDWLFRQSWFGFTQPYGVQVKPALLGAGLGHPASQLSMYYIALAVLVVAMGAGRALRRFGPGRVVIAVRDNERAAASFGMTPATVKLAMLAVSGFIAAVAGVLWADAWRTVSTGQFPPDASLAVLAVPVIGGLGSVGGAVAGAVFIYVPTYFVSPLFSRIFGNFGHQIGFQLGLAGVGLIVALLAYPAGLAGMAQQAWEAFLKKLTASVAARTPERTDVPLEVTDVHVSFGGVRALDGASITVQPAEIVGLIGPNGSGKTTLMNVISGVLQPAEGAVRLFGQEMVGLPADYRAVFGLARSFQDAHLFPGLTVTETVQVALTRARRAGFLSALVAAPWARATEASSEIEARAILDRLGLSAWADVLTSDLSTGTRRICDLAAQVATRPKIVLLDEPTAGVAQREAEVFGPLLRRIRDELDCSVLIVEHDMPMLMGLCDRVYALESGRVIAEGTPDEIRANPLVIASYLGSDDTAVARSGVAVKT